MAGYSINNTGSAVKKLKKVLQDDMNTKHVFIYFWLLHLVCSHIKHI